MSPKMKKSSFFFWKSNAKVIKNQKKACFFE